MQRQAKPYNQRAQPASAMPSAAQENASTAAIAERVMGTAARVNS